MITGFISFEDLQISGPSTEDFLPWLFCHSFDAMAFKPWHQKPPGSGFSPE
jgi:hypothetical protein